MKKISLFALLILFNLCSINAHSIVGGIRIFYNRTFLTFKKEDKVLTINLNHILRRSAMYQYINSSYNNGYYYILFFAKSWWLDIPSARGEWGAGQIETAFIVKIGEDFEQYEINNQFLCNFEPQEYKITTERFQRNGTIFYWAIMGSNYNGNDRSNRSEIWRIISVDASRLEIGFVINEYRNVDLWTDNFYKINGVWIKYDDENYIFNNKLQ
jgi:hypothetical protein